MLPGGTDVPSSKVGLAFCIFDLVVNGSDDTHSTPVCVAAVSYCTGYIRRRDEVTGEWRRLHNEELNDLYYSLNIVRVIKSRRMRWAGHVARVGEERGVYRVLLGKPEGRRPLRRHRRRWVDNIRMNLQEVGCGYMDWIGLAQDRDRWRTLVSVVMNLRVR